MSLGTVTDCKPATRGPVLPAASTVASARSEARGFPAANVGDAPTKSDREKQKRATSSVQDSTVHTGSQGSARPWEPRDQNDMSPVPSLHWNGAPLSPLDGTKRKATTVFQVKLVHIPASSQADAASWPPRSSALHWHSLSPISCGHGDRLVQQNPAAGSSSVARWLEGESSTWPSAGGVGTQPTLPLSATGQSGQHGAARQWGAVWGAAAGTPVRTLRETCGVKTSSLLGASGAGAAVAPSALCPPRACALTRLDATRGHSKDTSCKEPPRWLWSPRPLTGWASLSQG